MDPVPVTLAAAIIGGIVSLIVNVVGVYVQRKSPLAPGRAEYISDLEGRNDLLESENADLEGKFAALQKEFDAHKAKAEARATRLEGRVKELEAEVRRLERENLDFYRRYPELERRGAT